jgi:hypothetical protein
MRKLPITHKTKNLHNKLNRLIPALILCGGLISLLTGCHLGQEKATLSFSPTEQPTLKYAKSEIELFLTDAFLEDAKNEGINHIQVTFKNDSSRNDASFSYQANLDKNDLSRLQVTLLGKTDSDILCAAYTFLETGGYSFELSGPLAPTHFHWQTIKHSAKNIIPAIKQRGIRQHINFTMDVSAWPLKDAKNYIDNLARLRFNAISFHSYPGFWHAQELNDKMALAGHFFYGVHMIPDYLKNKTVNKKFFCIPSIEPFFEQENKRAELAKAWLKEVITEAKRVGFYVNFSFEPRSESFNIQKSILLAKRIVKNYPMIDSLEVMSEEIGGWGPRATPQQAQNYLKEFFGEKFANDKRFTEQIKKPSIVGRLYGQLGHNIKLIHYLNENKVFNKKIQLGIYASEPQYFTPSYRLVREAYPNLPISTLAGHHSQDVANNAKVTMNQPEDWTHTSIYSWIEFDGLMYLQQNPIAGIHDMVQQMTKNSPNNQGTSLEFNHWRTAENMVTAKFASEITLDSNLTINQFYHNYTKQHGMIDNGKFTDAMKLLGKIDRTLYTSLRGIGFCWHGRWRNGRTLMAYSEQRLKHVEEMYLQVRKDLNEVAKEETTPNGQSLLEFIDNRVRTSLIYLKAFRKGNELRPYQSKKTLTKEERENYIRICNEGIALLQQYADIYLQENRDRGCIGQLVSLWNGPIKAFKILRKEKCGVPFEQEIPKETDLDAPPLPMTKKQFEERGK